MENKKDKEEPIGLWMLFFSVLIVIMAIAGIVFLSSWIYHNWGKISNTPVADSYKLINKTTQIECTNSIEYNLTSLTNSIPECTCFRIDSTIVNFKDKKISNINWDKETNVNIDCCSIQFDSELLMREDKDWKCKCSFDWELKVMKIVNTTCYLKSYDVFNRTWNKCTDSWYPCHRARTTEEFKNVTLTIQINNSITTEIIRRNDTYENIFIHNLM